MEYDTCTSPSSKSFWRTPTVILFGGLPASGKSTLARRLVEWFGQGVIHLEYDELEDDIIQQKIEEERREAWNQARKVALNKLEMYLQKLKSNEESPSIFLLDDNFHLRGMRKQIHRLLLNHKPLHFGIIWMRTPLDVCLERNQRRERKIPLDVFEKMNQAMEAPRAAWEDYYIEVDNDTSFETIVSFVQACPEIVDLPSETVDEQQQQADRQRTMQNANHNWDKLLRTWVGKVAKYDKKLAQNANEARKDVMKLVKETQGNFTEDAVMSQFVSLIIANEEGRIYLVELLSDQL